MLARNFLTPTDLKISDKQFDALVQVLGMLERGELLWHNKYKVDQSPVVGFNMDRWPTPSDNCGSVGCIGYWCQKFGGDVTRDSIEKDENPYELEKLFFPVEGIKAYEDITVDEGMQALSNYLTTGKADWASVLA